MKFTNILEDILGAKPKIKLLRYLVTTGLELTGRRLAGVAGIHHRTAHTALKELASFGIVLMRQAGKALVYKVNYNNLLVGQILKPIFKWERELLSETIKTILKNIRIKVISAIIFGSVASSSERGTSDIDVLLLVCSKTDEEKLIERLEKIEYDFVLKYGNVFSPLVITIGEFDRRLRHKDKLMQNVIQKGKAVYGKTIQEVLIECRQRK